METNVSFHVKLLLIYKLKEKWSFFRIKLMKIMHEKSFSNNTVKENLCSHGNIRCCCSTPRTNPTIFIEVNLKVSINWT